MHLLAQRKRSAYRIRIEESRGDPVTGIISPEVEVRSMVTITFPDREVEKKALAFLLGRFSGRVLRSGEHLVPEAALEALADQNIPFTRMSPVSGGR